MPARIIALFAVAVLFFGCQSTGPLPLSADTYMIYRQSAGGAFASMGALKAKVIREANAFAASKGKVAVAISTDEKPAWPGHMPSFEYQFRLVDASDPRASGAGLEPRPDVVIEDRRTK